MGAFSVEMLPAREGDCLLLNWCGDDAQPRCLLIDGGRTATYDDLKTHLGAPPGSHYTFELFVITHVDRDHIEGALALLQDPDVPVCFKEVWFNAYHHLHASSIERLGAVQAESFTVALRQRGWPWNAAFHSGPVVGPADEAGPVIPLAGGLTLRVLSPDQEQLKAFIPQWERECRDAGLIPGQVAVRPPAPDGVERFGRINIDTLADAPFSSDSSKANATSIALLAEFDGYRVLLAGDAHVDRLVTALRRLAEAEGGRLRLDAFKTSHHGSQGNLSRELIELVDCPRWLVSTNGSYFNHPDRETIARIIKYGGDSPDLVFNYASEETMLWDVPAWRQRYGYRPMYPKKDGYITIEIAD